MPDPGLPQDARKAAEAAYRNWRIGDDGEGRLHAALVAATALIRTDERERIAALADLVGAVYDEDGDGASALFTDLIREPQERSDDKEGRRP